jgi:sterol desaturase/sphingolipid hydroxylase (fatty acid hydroxylase superfamily)
MLIGSIDPSQFRTAASIGVLVLLLLWESVSPFFDFFRGQWKERLIHGLRNVLISALNILVIALGFSLAWAAAAEWAQQNNFGVLNWLGLAPKFHIVAAVLLLDFWTYWWHWLNHNVPFFWRFHRMHHSDIKMDVTTANRFHLGEIVFSSILRIALIPLLGIRLEELVLYEVLLFAVVQFHHANIALPSKLDRALRGLIPTPAMHKVHHSRRYEETNSNYSSLLSIWDRIFGSFRLRADPHEIEFGLDEFESPKDQTISGMIRTPLKNSSKPNNQKQAGAKP